MNEAEDRVEYAEQNTLLRKQFDSVMTEPIPARMYLRRPAWHEHARAAAFVAVGIAIGMGIAYYRMPPPPTVAAVTPLPARAARAHLVYTPEVRHPVEVDAKEQDHLVKWLSKRLGIPLKLPVLTAEGYELLGGRLLPGPHGPVALFMYQDASGKRLTIYVTPPNKGDTTTAFRFAKEGPVSVFYWVDGDCGFAISGEMDKAALSRVATAVYRQVEDH